MTTVTIMQQADKPTAQAGPLASVLSLFNTSIGRKVITGLTGLGLVGFVIGHLAGNLTLFFGPEAFNAYAHKLESLGPILYVIEIGLIAVFVFHIFYAIAAAHLQAAVNRVTLQSLKQTHAQLINIVTAVNVE